MTPSDYVSKLYQLLLGRPPDRAGLEYWTTLMESSGDASEVLAGILGSDEYRFRDKGTTKQAAPEKIGALASQLPADRMLTIVDVGAQLLQTETHAYLPLLTSTIPCKVLGFDPLAERLEERAQRERGHAQDLLPFAIGDGGEHTLYVNNDDATSSMYPLNADVIGQFADMCSLQTVKTQKMVTHTLDEAVGGEKVDFLKLDIQGFELRSLEAAQTTLSRTAVVHCEAEFRQIYCDQPLFPDVYAFLTRHDFYFVDLFHPVNLALKVPSGSSGPDMLVFADAVFFRKPQISDPDLHIVQAIIALLVYDKPGLAEWVLHQHDLSRGTQLAALFAPPGNGPRRAEAAPQYPQEIEALPIAAEDKRRVAMTVSCRDCEYIPKVPNAGAVVEIDSVRCQVMHNGIRVLEDCYYGRWMTELIRLLRGHHEPQEEKVFHELLKYIGPGATMVELGSFWSYYSLWFKRAIAGARNFMIEPDSNNLEVGQKNFQINGATGRFINAKTGRASASPQPFVCESDGATRPVPSLSIDDLVSNNQIDRIDLLLADTQGAELEVLEGAARTISAGKLRFVLLSTHHHSISYDPNIHQRCLEFMRRRNAHIIAEHTVVESYSGDGLIVASFLDTDCAIPPVEISRNCAGNSLFCGRD